jgi:hypothetical protein
VLDYFNIVVGLAVVALAGCLVWLTTVLDLFPIFGSIRVLEIPVSY